MSNHSSERKTELACLSASNSLENNVGYSDLEDDFQMTKVEFLFKKNIRKGKDFGITKEVMDRLFYLPELLDVAILKRLDEGLDHYAISANFITVSKESIGLEYCFIAPDIGSAEEIFKSYKDEMGREALKVLLGFWKTANDHGRFDYVADITEIMAKTSDPGRLSYFSIKEKKRFWSLAKLLEHTKLTLPIPYKYKRARPKILTIEHRLIEIRARASEKMEESNGYPNKIRVCVLNPEEFERRAQLATAIANGTLRLPPPDVMLALAIQTRSAQRRDHSEITYSEEFLIKRGLLQKTRVKNSGIARKRLKEKMDRVMECGAIISWQKHGESFIIQKPVQI